MHGLCARFLQGRELAMIGVQKGGKHCAVLLAAAAACCLRIPFLAQARFKYDGNVASLGLHGNIGLDPALSSDLTMHDSAVLASQQEISKPAVPTPLHAIGRRV